MHPPRSRPKVSPRKSSRQPEAVTPAGAFADGLKALNRRERSVAEIEEWLAARGHEEDAVDEAIARLIDGGALDDRRLAECFAADKREFAGWGEERIAATLIDRGIERGLAEAAASEPYEDQADRAVRLLADRTEPLDTDAARNRALGFLTRRGFAYEVAYDAIRGLAENRR